MKLGDVMTRDPVIATPGQTLREAARVMHEQDTGFLPVGENDRLVGTLTDRDIAVKGVAAGLGPEAKVGEAMTPDVDYVREDDEADEVARNMGREKVRRMPVVDDDKRITGVISLGDLATRAGSAAVGEAFEAVSSDGGPHRQ